MNKSKQTRKSLRGVVFCCLLILTWMFGGVFSSFIGVNNTVFAEEPTSGNVETAEKTNGANANSDVTGTEENENATAEDGTEKTEGNNAENSEKTDGCKQGLGGIAWIGCILMEKTSNAVDALYGVIEKFLVINPIEINDETPIYKIWKYCLGVANIVFVIFLLIVIYSQITGLGISNYGIKKALPKLIVTAILVNLSFLICSLVVDVSNIVGNGLTGLFVSAKEAAMGSGDMQMTMSNLFGGLVSGTLATVAGGVIAFETGAIWMLIPVLLGALVSVAVGFFTIALRQAVVILLVMVAPVAIVAQVLPNTEQWFKKWKQYFVKMLVFYPLFSLLFGASGLAGFAIIMSATTIWGAILGMAVQIFPLFMSVKLMKMSGTFMGAMGMKVQGLFAKPLGRNRLWADSHRMLSRQRHLANPTRRPVALGLQKLEDRRNSRVFDTMKYTEFLKKRGLAYGSDQVFRKDGTINKKAEEFYGLQKDEAGYQQHIDRYNNLMNMGLSGKGNSEKQNARLGELDKAMVRNADLMHAEKSFGAKIEYDNSKGRAMRFREMSYARLDDLHKDDAKYRKHKYEALGDFANAKLSYDLIKNTMGNSDEAVQFAISDASQEFAAQAAVVQKKFETSADLTPATQDVYDNIMAMARKSDSNRNIDAIIGGMRILNRRGDTDIVKRALDGLLVDEYGRGKMQLGSYACQSVAKFLMSDVKDADPLLRRYGKYINLETAHAFNQMDDPSKRRRNLFVTFDEYINGVYTDFDENGNRVIRESKKDMGVLLEGTSFKGIERTAMGNMIESIRNASRDEDGNFDIERFKENQEKVWKAIMPNVIGDQFSFASGSEQIKAVAKAVTGMNGDEVDWKGIFGSEIMNTLTDEQKNDYLEFLNGRTKKFMNGHVANQAARTKSDMLSAVIGIFKKKAMAEQPGLSDEDYDEMADIKLAESLNPEVLDSLAIMYHKGYQGDTKANLTKHLKLNERYAEAQRRRNNKSSNKDDDDGGVVSGESAPIGGGDVRNAQRMADLQSLFRRYNYGGNDQAIIGEFWKEIKRSGVLSSMDADVAVDVQRIETLVNSRGYTNTADLLSDVENLINGL